MIRRKYENGEVVTEILSNTDVNVIVEQAECQPRLQEFIYQLYYSDSYQLNKLKSMDSDNREMAFYIVTDIFPENPFGNISRWSEVVK